jgi:hypothetical protein
MAIHFDRVERACPLAIGHTEASPKTAFATAGDKRGGRASRMADVKCVVAGYVVTARTRQTGDAFNRLADVDSQKSRDPVMVRRHPYRTPTRRRLSGDECFGERATSRISAPAAVRPRQHLLNLRDPRVIVDPHP